MATKALHVDEIRFLLFLYRQNKSIYKAGVLPKLLYTCVLLTWISNFVSFLLWLLERQPQLCDKKVIIIKPPPSLPPKKLNQTKEQSTRLII